MIKVFYPTETYFGNNGRIVLKPLKAKIKKEDNGLFYLDLECGIDSAEWFSEGMIISANTPQGYQSFRMTNVTKTKTKVSARCWHLFYDSENYIIRDTNVVNKTCAQALTQLNNATDATSPFTVDSDILTVKNYRCVRKSLCEAFEMVAERWGGHLVRDNFSVQVKSEIGKDRGVVIRYRKNMKEITVEENWDEVVTKLLPVGKDGTLLNSVDPTASIYVYSQTTYDLPYTKVVTFTQAINRDDYPDDPSYLAALVADLQAQAEAYVEKHSVPEVNYTLKAVVNYEVDIGDTIEVIDYSLGIDLMTNVISYEYDCILKKVTSLEFGNFKKTLGGLIPNITAEAVKKVIDMLQQGG